MKIFKVFNIVKELKGLSILIVPEDTGRETRTHKLSMQKILIVFFGYTVFTMLLGFFLMNITPLGLLVFPKYANLSSGDLEKIEVLNERMLFLSQELEKLKSTNDKLRSAISLGDSTLLDSLKKRESADKKSKIHLEGNLFSIIRVLLLQMNEVQNDLYFYPPAAGFISRSFNPEKGHMGTDYVLKTGTPVYSSASGYVIFSGFTPKDGYMIILSHPKEFVTVYKHCSTLLKKSRDEIMQGEMIALSGNSGDITTGPHLHFEIWKDGYPVDPEKYLINY
jgi:murein DD-endopeptidase MepM/ murein hydrolase activator NlpD